MALKRDFTTLIEQPSTSDAYGSSPIKRGRNSTVDEATDDVVYAYNKHQNYQDCPHELPCKVKFCDYCDKLFCTHCFNTHQEVLHLQNSFIVNFLSETEKKSKENLLAIQNQRVEKSAIRLKKQLKGRVKVMIAKCVREMKKFERKVSENIDKQRGKLLATTAKRYQNWKKLDEKIRKTLQNVSNGNENCALNRQLRNIDKEVMKAGYQKSLESKLNLKVAHNNVKVFADNLQVAKGPFTTGIAEKIPQILKCPRNFPRTTECKFGHDYPSAYFEVSNLVSKGDVNGLKVIISNNSQDVVNHIFQYRYGELSLLGVAAYSESLPMFQYLVETGHVNLLEFAHAGLEVNIIGWLLFEINSKQAPSAKIENCIEYLFKKEPKLTGNMFLDGYPALFGAAYRGSLRLVRLLIEKYHIDYNQLESDENILSVVVRSGQKHVFDYLLRIGADISQCLFSAIDSFHLATHFFDNFFQTRLNKQLVGKMANEVLYRQPDLIYQTRDDGKTTALMTLLKENLFNQSWLDEEILPKLLPRMGNITKISMQSSNSGKMGARKLWAQQQHYYADAVLHSYRRDRREMVLKKNWPTLGITKLASFGVKVADVRAADGTTIFHQIVQRGKYCCHTKDFIDQYLGDINVQLRDGSTALHLATMSGNIDQIHDLICSGINPSIKNTYGRTALDVAHDRVIVRILHKLK